MDTGRVVLIRKPLQVLFTRIEDVLKDSSNLREILIHVIKAELHFEKGSECETVQYNLKP